MHSCHLSCSCRAFTPSPTAGRCLSPTVAQRHWAGSRGQLPGITIEAGTEATVASTPHPMLRCVGPRIIDLAEMDRQILGGSPRRVPSLACEAEEQQAIATGLPRGQLRARQTQATSESSCHTTLSRTEEGKALVQICPARVPGGA